MASGNSLRVQQQADFTRALCHLLLWANTQGMTVVLGEAERPGVLADLYAKMGKGVSDSQHMDRLAADLALYEGGIYQTETAAYTRLGEQWKKFDRRARWGGDFTRPDGCHFEFIDESRG